MNVRGAFGITIVTFERPRRVETCFCASVFAYKTLGFSSILQISSNSAFSKVVKILVDFLLVWPFCDLVSSKVIEIPYKNQNNLLWDVNKKNVQNGVVSDLTKKCQICDNFIIENVSILEGGQTGRFWHLHVINFLDQKHWKRLRICVILKNYVNISLDVWKKHGPEALKHWKT